MPKMPMKGMPPKKMKGGMMMSPGQMSKMMDAMMGKKKSK